jgi:broad specificity phosphatase PhoE
MWSLSPKPDEALREIHCGALEGMPIAAVQRTHADLWQRNVAQNDDEFTWPGGESYRGFRTRVTDAMARIATAHAGQRVAVVTHAGVISQVLGTLRGRPAAQWQHDRPEPLSATEVIWDDCRPVRLVSYNVGAWW